VRGNPVFPRETSEDSVERGGHFTRLSPATIDVPGSGAVEVSSRPYPCAFSTQNVFGGATGTGVS
jgi:hypothetical protein